MNVGARRSSAYSSNRKISIAVLLAPVYHIKSQTAVNLLAAVNNIAITLAASISNQAN